jgi:hypothetical protein
MFFQSQRLGNEKLLQRSRGKGSRVQGFGSDRSVTRSCELQAGLGRRPGGIVKSGVELLHADRFCKDCHRAGVGKIVWREAADEDDTGGRVLGQDVE